MAITENNPIFVLLNINIDEGDDLTINKPS